METRISSISQLDNITQIGPDDLFIVSTPDQLSSSGTGYKTVSLKMKDFQEYLSAYIDQTFTSTISEVAGRVYSKQNIINTIRGSLQQTINNYIHDISGDVTVVIDAVNNVSGTLDQTINTTIKEVSGNVSAANEIINNVSADQASLSTNINQNISNISGDLYSENGIQSIISAIEASCNNTIIQTLANISGNVFAENSISTAISALSAYVHNEIGQVIDRINGSVSSDNSIFNQVSSLSTTIVNNIADIEQIRLATHYPIVKVGIDEDGHNQSTVTLFDKHVNVLEIDSDDQKSLYFEPAEVITMANKEYTVSRDLILYLKIRKSLENGTVPIRWDPSVTFVSQDDSSIFNDYFYGADYIYYLSEIDSNIMYVARQELNAIEAPTALTLQVQGGAE